MPFEAKLALFWVVVWAALWWLRRNPHSPLAALAFSWHGPFPREGEKKSRFYVRQALFALGWLGQFLAVLAGGALLAWFKPELNDSTPFLLVFAFAMPFAAGIALLGALLAGAVALKAAILGPDPECVYEAHGAEG